MAIRKIDLTGSEQFLPWVNEWVADLAKKELSEALSTGYYIYKYKFTQKGIIFEIPNKFSCFSFKSSGVYKAFYQLHESMPKYPDTSLVKGELVFTQQELTKALKGITEELTHAPCVCILEKKPWFELAFNDSCLYLIIERTKEEGWFSIATTRTRMSLTEAKEAKSVAFVLHPHSGTTFPLD